MAVNKFYGIGNLGKDPEIKFLEGGNSVCKFSIAITEKWTKDGEKQERTEWVNIEAWGKLAELAAEYLKKGSKCFVEGKLKTDKYQKEGQDHYMTKVVAHTIQFLDKKEGGQGQESPGGLAPADDCPF
ncbi:Single-stranded DNA-binding protein [Anaerolineae bacterium]|nr:Single-stranded DNA-binding protein [Anaerolineae bacterium]